MLLWSTNDTYTMNYTLHNYRRCPFCIRVRIVLHLTEVAYDVVEEPLRKWTPWMKDWSTQSGERPRVPVLRGISLDGIETIFTESNDINCMLDSAHGTPTYTPERESEAYQEMLDWFAWCDNIFKHQIDRFKYGENMQFDEVAHVADTAALHVMVEKLEAALQTDEYLLENRLTLADIAIIPFVRQIMRTREEEFDFTDLPRVERWTNSILNTDWFEKEIMKKY
jgi:glutathione S-transferase